MRGLVAYRVAFRWFGALVSRPCCVAKAKPVVAASAGSIAVETQIVIAIIAFVAMIM